MPIEQPQSKQYYDFPDIVLEATLQQFKRAIFKDCGRDITSIN